MIRALAPCAALLASPTAAQSLQGSWCGVDSGERFTVQGQTVGFNTTIICDSDSPVILAVGSSWSGVLSCVNANVEDPSGDGNYLIFEEPLGDFPIQIDVLTQDEMSVTPQNGAPETYLTCD